MKYPAVKSLICLLNLLYHFVPKVVWTQDDDPDHLPNFFRRMQVGTLLDNKSYNHSNSEDAHGK